MLRYLFILLLLLPLAACVSTDDKKVDNAESHYVLGVSYLRSANPTMALKEFLLAEQYDDDDDRVQNGLGQSYYYKHAYAEAEHHYLRAIDLSDGNPQYQNNLAACYLEMQRYDDAIRYFKLAAENYLFARGEIAWSGIGTAQLKKGAYAEALEAFNSALSMNRRYAPAYLYRGESYYALGKTDKAIKDYRQALGYAPDLLEAHYQLGVALMKRRDTAGALQAFKKVVDLAPDSDLGHQANNFVKVLH